MRTSLLFSVTLLWATAALGQQVGNRIVVIAKAAQLKVQNEVLGAVPPRNILMSSEAEKKKWSFLLELYKSGKPYRDEKQDVRSGSVPRHSAKHPA